MLLGLRSEDGFVPWPLQHHLNIALSGALIAELLMDGRISVDDSRKRYVVLLGKGPGGDPLLNEALDLMQEMKARVPLRNCIAKLNARFTRKGIATLRDKAARPLCDCAILRVDHRKRLLIFRRTAYPEINPQPKREILERVRGAIFSDGVQIDERTRLLISCAGEAGFSVGDREIGHTFPLR
jgi:hypothetical protein